MKKELKRILNVVLRQRTQRRIWAAALAVCMTVTMMPIQTYAVEAVQTVETVEDTGGLCEHHTEHTPECGYTEATEGSPCMHIAEGKEHSEDCYKTVEDCIHKHTADCYDDAATELASDSNAGDPVNCAHMCSEDTGCITKKSDCPHEKNSHDDECGYVAESEGTPCTFVCERCNGITEESAASAAVKAVQAMLDRLPTIDALPDPDSESFAEYLDTLKSDVEAARRGYDALTEEEKPMLTSAGLEKLTALEELLANVPMLMAEGTRITNETELRAMTSSGTYYLANDIRLEKAWTPLTSFTGTLDGKGYTISNLKVKANTMYVGFITSLMSTGTIKNLTVDGTVESTSSNSGRTGGIVGKNAGTIINCTFLGEVWSVAGENHAVGGICGRNEETGTITDCTNKGKVAGKGDPQAVYVGGITGSNKGTINNSTNSGSISAESTATKIYQGDLVGSIGWEGSFGYIGGIAGDTEADKITNCTNSGSITVNGSTSHICNGITFDKVLTAERGALTAGNYYLDSDVTLTNTLTSSGTVNLCLNGHTLTSTGVTMNIYITGGKLSLYDCSTDSAGKSTGACVRVYSGQFNLYSGSIADITGSNDGGGVRVDANGTFNMYGGVISGNTVTGRECNGGGVYTQGTFRMTGGKITGNSTTGSNGSGGGIYVAAAAKSAQIGGTAEISGNSVNGIGGKGGGVYMGRDFNLAGAVKITGNTEVTSGTALQSNLYLPNTKALVTAPLTGDIGVTVSNLPLEGNTYSIAAGSSYILTENDAKCFSSDAESYEIKLQDGKVVLKLISAAEVEYTTGGQTLTGSLSDALTAINVSGGSIKLLTDVSSAGVSLPAKAVSIDLNGRNWTASASINVMNGSTLTVSDSAAEKSGTIIANDDHTVLVYKGGTVNLTGGTLSAGTIGYDAIKNSGTVNIDGGNVRKTVNTSTVSNESTGIFTLKSGSVENTDYGVALSNGGTFHISGGTISSNAGDTVNNRALGVLHISGGTLSSRMTNGLTITNRGDIYLSGNPTWNSSSGIHIGMYDAKATLTANNGKAGAEIYSESKVKVTCVSIVAKPGYVVVQGLKDQNHSADFSFDTAPTGLEYQYNDTDKQIKLVTKIPKYALTVTNGTITSSDTSGTYEENTSVTVTANTAPTGQQFKEWTATGLTNTTYTTNPLTVTMPAQAVTLNAVYEAIPTYTITASPDTKNFGKLEKGYTPPAAETITVTNTGNQSITLTQPTTTSFTIGALSATTVAPNGTATFTIQPKAGLTEGSHFATITIRTDFGTSAAVDVSFTVTPPSITGFTFTETPSLKEEQDNVKIGAVAGVFSNPQGGTEPFTYALAANNGNDTDNGKFTIDGTNLKVGDTALTKGTYKAYVLVTDKWSKTFGKAITITVAEADPRYTITASPTEKDFGSLEKGYTQPAAQTITVTNTGNTSVELTRTTNENYIIGTLSSTTVAAGGTATFTIQPKAGLEEGSYTATITISTNHSTNAAVVAQFTVTPPSITDFTFTQTSGLKEEQDNVKTGAVAGTFSNPKGGTGAFTYTLASNSGNDTDNGKFTIDGANLKVGSSALTEGTYKAYVLATDTKGKTFGKAITVTVAESDPRYTITANPTEKDFGKLVEDYTAPPTAQTVTITNTGNQTMTLTQPTSTNFTIGALSSLSVAKGKTVTFTVQPKSGLKEKAYEEIITISASNATSATVTAKFEVTLPSITGYTFTQTAGLQEEKANAEAGAVAGTFSDPKGGIGAFTYTLTAHTGNDTDNGKFTIDGTNLKVGSSALTEGTYQAYVLATDTKGKTFGKAITITVLKADPRYTIIASPSDADFGKLLEDYTTPPAVQTITVTNTGNQTMTLTQPTGTNFTIGALSSTTIARDKTATFTIQPKPDLTEKEYSETISIKTDKGTGADVTAKFEVTLPVIDGYTFTQTTGLQEEKTNAETGVVAGTFSDPQGGTGAFTYTLTAQAGDDTDNGRFEIAGTNLKVKGNALTEGTYKAYVLATDTKGKTFGKAITVTVAKADPRYTITASPTDKDFGSVRRKYTAPAAQTITITNTGNQTMTLTQPVSTNFIIGALSRTTIERDTTATFTIQPITGLNEGVYDETVTISTGNGTNATVAVKFTVTSALVYDLTVNGSYAESTGAGTYEGEATVNINAGTRSRYTFTGWTSSGGGTFADAGSASTTFTMPEGNVTITAAWRSNGGGGGGGGSSSGGSGGSSSGTTPPPSQPVVKIPGTGQATIPTTVDQNGNANVSVTDKNITDAIADAKKDAVQGQPITVEIKVNTDKDASQLITTLPQSVRDTLINNQVGSLTIGSKDVSMKFSQAALGQMNAQAQGNLIITATKADTGKLTGNAQTLIGNRPTYDFKATCDGRIITELGVNAVTITIPYILKEGETAVNVQAFRVDANGVATVVPGSYYDAAKQAIVFATGDISATYGVGYRQAAASVAHRVQRGETLAMIARRYQTTVQAIAALNGISNPDRIEVGQEIRIPQK